MDFPILSIMIFTPLVGMIIVMLMNKEKTDLIKYTSVAVSIIPLVLSVLLWFGYDSSTAQMQFVERYQWIPSLSIQYFSAPTFVRSAMPCFVS